MDGSKRKARPCDGCRRRKIRCIYASDDANECILCRSRGTDCTFLEKPPRKKRAIRSGNENGQLDPKSPMQRQFPSSTEVRSPPEDYSTLPGPTMLKRTFGHQNRQSCSYFGATSEHDPLIINSYHFDQKEEYRSNGMPGIWRRVSQETHYLMRVDTPSEAEQDLGDLDQIEAIVSPYGQALVKLYFRIVHPSFPIIHKKIFLEKHGRTYRELTPLGLAAVYLLALDWWYYSSSLASLPKPNVAELEAIVSKAMDNMHLRPKISDIQACLVIAQRPQGDSWARTGTLLSMAQTLGIHLDCSDWSIPEWEKSVRNRVAWSLFMQDKWGALIYGKPSHIVQDNWEVKPLEWAEFPETAQDDDDEEGSSEIEVGKQIFLAMISLTEIVSDILSNLFTLKVMRSNLSTAEVLERARPLQIRLKNWYTGLLPSLLMGETKARKLSSIGYLHLAYFVAEITLHRAIIRSHCVVGTPEELRSITRAAAKARFTSAVSFVKQLKPEHLQSFWYFATQLNLSIIGTFGIILLNTSSSEEERKFYTSELAEYRWILRVSSTGAALMKHAVTVLDANSFSQEGLQATSMSSDRSSVSNSEEMADVQNGWAFDDSINTNTQIEGIRNMDQYFDISLDDLSGYTMEQFPAFV
jgi:hypothetical protein